MTPEEEHEKLSEDFLFFFLCLLVAIFGQHFTRGLHYFSDIGSTILVGMFASLLAKYFRFNSVTLKWGNELFFFGFLPPIIFESGYNCLRNYLLSNLNAIVLLAFVGTILSMCGFALAIYYSGVLGWTIQLSAAEAMTFGALISSIDPTVALPLLASRKVDPNLYYLLFGESLLNDAVCVTVYRLSSSMIGKEDSITPSKAVFTAIFTFFRVSILSALIGYTFALLFSVVLKHIHIDHKHRIQIITLFITTVYVPFFVSEFLGLSGIVTILFTGIASRRYISHNIDQISRRVVSFEFRLLSYIAETVAFLSMGMSIASESLPTLMALRTLGITIILIILTRALNVYPLLSCANMCRRFKRKYVLSYSNINTSVEEDSEIESQSYKCEDNNDHSCKECKNDYSSLHNSNNSSSDENNVVLIPWKNKHMIVYAGLRGAISFSLAKLYPNSLGNSELIVFLTTGVIIFTIFFQGLFTNSLLGCLEIEQGIDRKKIQENMMKQVSLGNANKKDSIFDWIEREIIYKAVVRSQETSGGYSYHQETTTPGTVVDESSLGGTYALSEVLIQPSIPVQYQMPEYSQPSPHYDFHTTAASGSMMKSIFLDVDEEASVDISSLDSSSWHPKNKGNRNDNATSKFYHANNLSGPSEVYDDDDNPNLDDDDDDDDRSRSSTISSSSAFSSNNVSAKSEGRPMFPLSHSIIRSTAVATTSIKVKEDVTISVARSRSFASSGLPMLLRTGSQSNFFSFKHGRKPNRR